VGKGGDFLGQCSSHEFLGPHCPQIGCSKMPNEPVDLLEWTSRHANQSTMDWCPHRKKEAAIPTVLAVYLKGTKWGWVKAHGTTPAHHDAAALFAEYKAKVKEDRKENPKADKQAHNALLVKAKDDDQEFKKRKVIYYAPDSDESSSSESSGNEEGVFALLPVASS
jgi:hypothetical protein